MRTSLFAVLALLVASAACVDTRPPPNLPKQVEVSYGPKVYLIEATQDFTPFNHMCTRFGTAILPMPATSTVSTATVTPTDNLLDSSGKLIGINARQPHNCYVNVVSSTRLHVDAVEVTNDLFQLCVDSGVCDTPDPSKASKGDACTNADKFEECPVGQVTQTEAGIFCQFIGRRLPAGIEHVIMRQSMGSAQDPKSIGVFPNGKDETKAPASCNEAVIGAAGCRKPQPITLTSNPDDTKGAAVDDNVNGIYDLMGNMAEWSADRLPAKRRLDLPWFCADALPLTPDKKIPSGCPKGTVCGNYQPQGQAYGEYPVCIAWPNYQTTSGAEGSLFGGSYLDDKADRDHIGTFARRKEPNPDGEQLGGNYGFRCVGDLGVADQIKAP